MNVQINNQNNYKIGSLTEGEIEINGNKVTANIKKLTDTLYHVILNNTTYEVEVAPNSTNTKNASLTVNGTKMNATIKDALDEQMEKMGIGANDDQLSSNVEAPMPGLILEVLIQPGDAVEKGNPLLILEAMKMENVLKAEGSGIVKEINAKVGDSVNKKDVLITFE